MWKPVILVLVLVLCVFSAAAQQSPNSPNPAASTIPAEAAHQVNPVKPTPESLAQGKKYYGYDCAMCHGANGNGKGEVAVDEKMTLGDFSDPATLKDKTDGELFYIIKNGKGQMPPEGDRVKAPDLWSMVNYIRSLAKKGQ
jgi:mono/diheme cytochrome c family protein